MSDTPREHRVTETLGFGGLRVAAFESRQQEAMRQLISRHGGVPLLAPALREVPLHEHHEALAFADRLFAGEVDLLLCLTGVGTRTLAEAIGTRHSKDRLRDALIRITVVARGPKPAAVLRDLGVTGFLTVPEPNTWQELLALLDARGSLQGRRLPSAGTGPRPSGQRVVVQEYGIANEPLLQALRDRGAEVSQVPVYRWALPEDTRPLRQLLHTLADGEADVVLFTNAAQVEHVHRIAREEGLADRLARACRRMVLVAIGPICRDALRHHGYPVDLEPAHPKMGVMVQDAAARAPALLRQKRAEPA